MGTNSRTLAVKLQTREANADQRTVPVVVSTTFPVDRGSFFEVLSHAKGAVNLERAPLPVVIGHERAAVNVGLVDGLRIDGTKLQGVMRLGQSSRADDLWPDIQSGIIRSVSAAYSVEDYEERAGYSDKPTITVTKWTPLEVSLLAVPADPHSGLYRSIHMEKPNDQGNVTDINSARTEGVQVERARIESISDLFEPHRARGREYVALESEALRGGWTLERARQALLDLYGGDPEPLAADYRQAEGSMNHAGEQFRSIVTSTGRRIVTSGAQNVSDLHAAMRDGILMRLGYRGKDFHAAARDFVDISALEMARIQLNSRGINASSLSRSDLWTRVHTTSDFASLLGDVANKAIRMGRENSAATYDPWVRKSEARDFKAISRVSLSAAGDLDQVYEGGEFKHTSMSDEAETFSIATYGRLLSLTRQAIINDDLAELARIPQAFTAAALRKTADLVYGVITANAAMSDSTALFHADHANLGAGDALSADSLGALIAVLRKQRPVGGVGYLNPTPRWLLVPPELELTARTILSGQFNRGTPGGTTAETGVTGARNIFGDLEVIVEPRLSDNSTTAFYVIADDVDFVELAYLSGTSEGISIETENEFTRDALSWKVRLEVGAKAIDWRGAVKDAGV